MAFTVRRHVRPEDCVDPGLVTLAHRLEPSQHVLVDAQGRGNAEGIAFKSAGLNTIDTVPVYSFVSALESKNSFCFYHFLCV
jgi:hypothetical protein